MANINDIMIYTLIQQPFYGALLSSIMRIETQNIETAGVTIKTNPILYYNLDYMEELEQNKACGVLIHELLHLILLHQFRENGKDHELWNIACDLAVNQLIDMQYLPEGCITLEAARQIVGEYVPSMKSAEEYYDLLKDNIDTKKVSIITKNNKIEINITNKDGETETYAINALDELNNEDKDFVKSLMKGVIDSAIKTAGSMPNDAIDIQLQRIYKPPQMNWRMLLRKFLNSKGRLKYRYTYKRESRRFPNAPGKRKMVGMKILVGIDESGSVSNDDLQIFTNELKAIQKISGSNIYVAPFDAEVSKPIPLRNYILSNKRKRSGGTEFKPVFDLARKMRIDTVIMFTDGYATIPEQIASKTLWVITNNGQMPNRGIAVQFNE